MQYVKIMFALSSGEQSDILIALLAEAGYDGFEESGNELLAYIERPKFHEEELREIARGQSVDFNVEIIPAQNWNALWESNFQPVIVEDFCTIRADFHKIVVTTPYDILITPKMSFGTGHHATTQLVMLMMRDTDLKGAKVLDFGTGTGVLAILAEKLGATDIMAIDNDDWCVENAQENVTRNSCKHIKVLKGSLDEVPANSYQVILANINRHILLQHMGGLYDSLDKNGTIIMSGLLLADEPVIVVAAEAAGFKFKKMSEQSNWISLVFNKV